VLSATNDQLGQPDPELRDSIDSTVANRTRTLAVVASLSLLAAACGARFPKAPGGVTAGTGNETAEAPVDSGTAATTAPTVAGGGPATTVRGQARAGGTTATTAATGSGGARTVSAGPSPGVTDSEVKIGYLVPIHGAAPVPQDFERGARSYYEYVNRHQGGVFGRKVTPVIRDTQSDANIAKQEAEKLVDDDKVFAVVALDRLENQRAIGQYLDSRHVPNIEIQTPANLGRDQTWTFGVTIDHFVQGALIADYMVKTLRASRVAVVYENTPDLEPGVKNFKDEIGKLGAAVTYTKTIDGQGNDFSGEAQALSVSGASVVWLYMAPTPAAKLASQAFGIGYHPTWFANSISWGFDLALTAAPTALAGARAFSPWLPLTDPRTKTYQDAYREQNPNSNPDDLGIVGWGVGEIVVESLKRTGRTLGQNVFRETFQNMNFTPDIFVPLAFGAGVREGANQVAVLKANSDTAADHWVLERDFTGSI
jgi:branched-chain amino acid transport system substrate-binding protein